MYGRSMRLSIGASERERAKEQRKQRKRGRKIGRLGIVFQYKSQPEWVFLTTLQASFNFRLYQKLSLGPMKFSVVPWFVSCPVYKPSLGFGTLTKFYIKIMFTFQSFPM